MNSHVNVLFRLTIKKTTFFKLSENYRSSDGARQQSGTGTRNNFGGAYLFNLFQYYMFSENIGGSGATESPGPPAGATTI